MRGLLSFNGQVGDPAIRGLDAIVIYFRDGVLEKAGQTTFRAHNTTMYMSARSTLTMLGGSNGTLVWTAPTTGQFDHLALWSETAAIHELAGQSYLNMVGIFFTAAAQVLYRGNGVQHQIEAQFVARKLKVSGQGILILRPSFDSAVLIPDDIVALIR